MHFEQKKMAFNPKHRLLGFVKCLRTKNKCCGNCDYSRYRTYIYFFMIMG